MEMKLDAGQEIDSRCLKCKDVTNHTIIAMAEGKIAKVECNTCGGKHMYRPPKPAAKAKNPAGRSTEKAAPQAKKVTQAAKKSVEIFNSLINGRNLSDAIPYTMTSLLMMDNMVEHSHFGMGIVTATIPPNKVEMTFESGTRILVCQLPSPERQKTAKSPKKRGRKRQAAS